MTAILFRGGTVWTGCGKIADALLVREGRIAALGEDARRLGGVGNTVEIVDLAGGFLMPSFGDGHAHPMLGGLESLGPQVRACASIGEIVAEVRRFAAAHPDLGWITGGSYDRTLAPGGLFDARWLDEAVSDRPVVLRAADYHTAWCNSEALRRCGIGDDTPDPELGDIPRRSDGSVLGTLREWGAVDLVLGQVPRDVEVGVAALEAASDYFLRRGVTWVQDAWVNLSDVDVYLAAVNRGRLGVRFNLAFHADPRRFRTQVAAFVEARGRVAELRSPLLAANTVKFFADGVVGNETASLLRPYCSALHSHGLRVWDHDTLAQAARLVDEHGFQIHVHAIGDAAVRQALDAIEYVVAANGSSDRRPVIAHAELIDDADLGRFAQLGVIANMQPLWAQLDSLMTDVMLPRLGADRVARMYRMQSLAGLGARVSFGSDWPVSSGAPLAGIAVAVTRPIAGDPTGAWTSSESLTVEQALTAYTSSVAAQAFSDRSTPPGGTLRAGASADLVWLDRDPRTAPTGELADIAVLAVWLAGRRQLR